MIIIMSKNDIPCLHVLWNQESIGICDPIHIKDDKSNNTIRYQEG